MKQFSLGLLAIFVGTGAAQASLPLDSYFCRKLPVRPPDIYAMQANRCAESGAPSENSHQSVCLETAYCAYLDEKLQQSKVMNAAGKPVSFSRLSKEEKEIYLVKNLPVSYWLPSTLTCAKLSPHESNECPALENCKGDLNFGWAQGAFSPTDDSRYRATSANPNAAGAFDAGSESTGDSAR